MAFDVALSLVFIAVGLSFFLLAWDTRNPLALVVGASLSCVGVAALFGV